MSCSKREIGASLIPIYKDVNIYIDSLFSVEYNLQGDRYNILESWAKIHTTR